MTGEQSNDDDKILDEELDSLYRSTSNETSPAQLDRTILAAAKKALGQSEKPDSETPQAITVLAWRRWSTPLAAAACLLLGLSVALNLVLLQRQSILLPSASELSLQDDTASYEVAPTAQLGTADARSKKFIASPAAEQTVMLLEEDKSETQNLAKRQQKVSASIADSTPETRLPGKTAAAPMLSTSTSGASAIEKAVTAPLQKEIDEIIQLLQARRFSEAKQLIEQLESAQQQR